MKRKIVWIIGFLSMMSLLGCGQKGPLKPAQSPPSIAAADYIYAN